MEHALRQARIAPLVPEVPPAGKVAERAEALASQLFRMDTSSRIGSTQHGGPGRKVSDNAS